MNDIVEQTEAFAKWHSALRDLRAKTAIARRIDRAEHGNLGDVKPVGGDVSEMRVDVGAGIGFTLHCAAAWSWYCSPAATNPRNKPTLNARLNLLRRFKS